MPKHDFEKLIEQMARETLALLTFTPVNELMDEITKQHRATLIHYLANKFTKYTIDDKKYFEIYEHITGLKKNEVPRE